MVAEQREQLRREHHRDRRDRGEPRERQPPHGRGDAPGAVALALREQLVEDRHERGAERRVGDQRADQIRDLVRDGEGVDRLALHREDPRGRRLAEHADEAARAGGDGEERGRDRHATPLGCLGCLGCGAPRSLFRNERGVRGGWSEQGRRPARRAGGTPVQEAGGVPAKPRGRLAERASPRVGRKVLAGAHYDNARTATGAPVSAWRPIQPLRTPRSFRTSSKRRLTHGESG